MPNPYQDKLRSLRFTTTKLFSNTTTDDHGTHTVKVTETDFTQDVHVELPTITRQLKGTVN